MTNKMIDTETLSGLSMKKILDILMDDSEFKQALVNLISNWEITEFDHTNNDHFKTVISILIERLADIYPDEKIPPQVLKNALEMILNDKESHVFIRVIKIMEKIFSHLGLSSTRVNNYIDQLKFSTTRGIDLYQTSKLFCDQMIDKRQRSIDLFNPKIIDFLTNFTPDGLKIVSELIRLPKEETNFILSLNAKEIQVYNKLTPKIMSLLLKVDNLTGNPHKLNSEELDVLNRLIINQRRAILELSENGEKVITRIKSLTKFDRQLYLNFGDEEKLALKDITFEDLNNLIKTSQIFGEKTMDLIRSLKKEQKQLLVRMGKERKLSKIAYLTQSARTRLTIIKTLNEREDVELFNLTPDQRSILAKVSCLRRDGIQLISTLIWDQISQVFELHQSQTTEIDHLNLSQRVLFKRINYLNPEDKTDLLALTENDWLVFEEIKNIPNSILLDLSWEGRIILKKMSKYTQNELRIIRNLSTRGMAVLAGNSNLTPQVINQFESMKIEEGRLLLNLNLEQRYHIRFIRKRDWRLNELFQPKDIETMKRLSTTNERILIKLTRFDNYESSLRQTLSGIETRFTENVGPSEMNVVSMLNQAEVKELATNFDSQIEKQLPFVFWGIMLDPGQTRQEKKAKIEKYLSKVFQRLGTDLFLSTTKYTKLIAAITTAVQTNQFEQLELVQVIKNIMNENENNRFWSISLFLFYLYNYSTTEDLQHAYLTDFLSTINEDPSRLESIGWRMDSSDEEELLHFRRRLINQQTTDPFYRITKYNLMSLALDNNHEVLNKITSINDEISSAQIIRALRYRLKGERYIVSQRFFFSQEKNSHEVSDWLSNILDENERLEFLSLPVNRNEIDENHLKTGLQYRRDIFQDAEIKQPNIFECALYYDRGDALPILEKLNGENLALLFDRYPSALLRYATRFGKIELLRFFDKKIGNVRLKEFIKDKNHEIVRSFLSSFETYVFGLSMEHHQNLINTVRWLMEIEPHLPTDLYRQMAIKCALLPQSTKTVGDMNFLLDNLSNDLIPRGELIQLLKQHSDQKTSALFLEGTGQGCTGNSMRKRREFGLRCVDSRKEGDNVEELSRISKEHVEFYNRLLHLIRAKSSDQPFEIPENLIKDIGDMNFELVDPEVGDIVKDLKANVDNESAMRNILTKFGVAEKIEKTANSVGLIATIFFVGKHVIGGDLEGFGYDAINLWIMPAIGEQVEKSLIEWSSGASNNVLKTIVAPSLGRAIGNFGGFLGLMDAIETKRNATKNSLKEQIANLNIVTNAIFIAADVPEIIINAMSAIDGIQVGIAGALAGPIGTAISVFVFTASIVVEVIMEVDQIAKEIDLTGKDKFDLFLSLLVSSKISDNIKYDLEAKNNYDKYLSSIINQFKSQYSRIAIMIPALELTTGRYVKARSKRQILVSLYQHLQRVRSSCAEEIRTLKLNFVSNGNIVMRNTTDRDLYRSRLFSKTIDGFDLVCGPSANNVERKILNHTTVGVCFPESYNNGKELSRTMEKWYIPRNKSDACQNIVVYQNNLTSSSRTLLYLSEDAEVELTNTDSIDVIHHGKNLSITDVGVERFENSSRTNYRFTSELDNCRIHKRGLNFFYVTTERFSCDLGDTSEGQRNIAMIRGSFTDSKNIDIIFGGTNTDYIQVSNAKLVNGNGGGDIITAKNFTVVVGHFGDSIGGPVMTLLPMSVEEISQIVIKGSTTIYNKNNESIVLTNDAVLKSNDGFFIIPIRKDSETHEITDLLVFKTLEKEFALKKELSSLKRLKNQRFDLIKRATNEDHDIVVSGRKNHVFALEGDCKNHYWEASANDKHLYFFNNVMATVTISKGNGLMDFSLFGNRQYNHTKIFAGDERKIIIDHDDLRVIVLPNYKNLMLTYDQQKYYKIENNSLVRDYCSHRLTVNGQIVINGTELFNLYNCFVFDSDKIIFLKSEDDDVVLLSSGKHLSIRHYFSNVYNKLDLSLSLRNQLIIPEEFKQRAERPNTLKYYRVDEESKLVVYHNQPENEYHIGWIDFKNLSVLDCDLVIVGKSLFASYQNNTIVELKNWKVYDPAREIMFAFNDTVIYNTPCIVSFCHSNDILIQFRKRKSQIRDRKREINPSSTEIPTPVSISNPRIGYVNKFDQDICSPQNLSLALLLFRNYIDKKYPRPEFHFDTPEQVLAQSICIVEKFRKILTKTADKFNISIRSVDFYDLHLNILGLMKDERYSHVPGRLYSVAENISSKITFLNVLKDKIKKLLNRPALD